MQNTLYYGDNLRILSIDQLLDGTKVEIPPSASTFKQAGRVRARPQDHRLGFDSVAQGDDEEALGS